MEKYELLHTCSLLPMTIVKIWVFLFTEKSLAFHVVKRFKILVEKEKNASIKSLRTDHGGVHITGIQ